MSDLFDIRLTRESDCFDVAEMSNAIHVEHDYENPPHSEASIAKMMFGADAILKGLIAHKDGKVCGQALFQPFYNPDISAMGLWMTELYVIPEMRSAKLGETLMIHLSRYAQERGFVSIWWSVLGRNEKAVRFYKRLGAYNSGSIQYELRQDRLADLAQKPADQSELIR